MNISQLLTKLKTLVYSKSETDSLLGGKASSSHTHTKSQITDFPTIPSKVSQLTNDSGFITGVSWDNVSGKPSTFTPSSHTHTKSQITDFPTIPTNTNQLTNGAGFITSSGSCSYSTTSGTSTYSTYLKSLGSQTPKSGRDIFHSGVYTYTTYTDTNTPAHYGAVIGYGNGQGGSCEMFAEWVRKGNLWFRVLRDCDDSWTNWQQIITSDNIGSQSVNYANSSGNADTVDGSHAWQMQTLSSSGGVHGSSSWLLQCQHNVDGDGYFKLYCGDKSLGTKVDRASSAGYADSAGSSSIATRDSGGTWIHGRDNAVVKQTRHSTTDGSSWNPAVSIKTKDGNWTIGTVGYNNLQFSYDTDADYNTGSNRSIIVDLLPQSGRIITSANTGNISISGYQVYVG